MIRLENVSIRAGSCQLGSIGLDIPTGAYAVLMGRTGSGKTTLLEAICGLRCIAAGRVFLMNQDVTNFKPAWRGIGYVPQDPALFGTMTVREHLAFAPSVAGWQSREIGERIVELAELLNITHLLDRKPHGLSGGEAQRVSLGRALARRPRVLCLDEPLSALDDETRAEMQQLLRSVRERSGVTILHVTHQSSEARSLADQVLVLRHGRVEPSSRTSNP
jgi:molybdate/tungstate transport system ATP-binding protein